ncbi:hypothetical protein ElyMa_002666600 [Elysia marginata]|uniref:Uncharacterized protein n=1 Tax=Elysia marginata TaxID=1093978 RepID=A0AAV4H9I5_9GAST|nr:hypothetical protein ElyMa_002666600 [Elysia marginata]
MAELTHMHSIPDWRPQRKGKEIWNVTVGVEGNVQAVVGTEPSGIWCSSSSGLGLAYLAVLYAIFLSPKFPVPGDDYTLLVR